MIEITLDKMQLVGFLNHVKYASLCYFELFLNYELDDMELNEIYRAKTLRIDNKKYKIIKVDSLNDFNETKLIIEYEYK